MSETRKKCIINSVILLSDVFIKRTEKIVLIFTRNYCKRTFCVHNFKWKANCFNEPTFYGKYTNLVAFERTHYELTFKALSLLCNVPTMGTGNHSGIQREQNEYKIIVHLIKFWGFLVALMIFSNFISFIQIS